MLARADSPAIQSLPAASPPPFPAWARPVKSRRKREAEAAFLAGAALARLDAIVRENPPWAGVWRQRLALERRRRQRAPRRPRRRRGGACATLSISPGRAPIPDPQDGSLARLAGARRPPDPQWRSQFERAAEVLGVPRDEALQAAIEAAEACAAGNRPAPFAAARAFALARRALTRAPGAVAWRPGRGGRAPRGLARRRRARAEAEMAVRPAVARRAVVRRRRSARRRRRCSPTAPRRRESLFAYARAAAQAADLAADLARRAQKLPRPRQNCAPRAQGPRCRRCSTRIASPRRQNRRAMSERGARRLFDRLVALGAVRELTGRATFRLYGL